MSNKQLFRLSFQKRVIQVQLSLGTNENLFVEIRYLKYCEKRKKKAISITVICTCAFKEARSKVDRLINQTIQALFALKI